VNIQKTIISPETYFDTNSSISEILTTVVSYLLLPHPTLPLVLEAADDAQSFFPCVDSNTTISVVYRAVVLLQYLRQYGDRAGDRATRCSWRYGER
jgi:hypothetical protein